MVDEIDLLVRSSLSALAQDSSMTGWTGRREREIVSLFCFGYLLRECRPGAFLHDPTQIAIEVGVPQVVQQALLSGKPHSKSQVCKDIVLWPRPRMTCWDSVGAPTVRPASIIEWKHNEGDVCAYDVQWLAEFSSAAPDFVGYAVSTIPCSGRGIRLSCTRIHQGQALAGWLVIN
jgi:hypothetical protein